MADIWRFGPVSEADFEPLLALRIDVMREHLERVFRYSPEGARRFFREAFDEPGLRLILVGDEMVGCVALRTGEGEIKIDSFYLARRYHNRGLGSAILKVLLAEADALRLPVRLEVLHGSPAGRFYERHGFAKLDEDDVEAQYGRPVRKRGSPCIMDGPIEGTMRSMTVKEARDSFDRMLEAAKREGVVLRDDETDVAMILSPQEYARFRQWRAEGLLKAMNELAAEAAANGLTEEKLADLLNQSD